MAVKVKLRKRARQVGFGARDFAHPDERSAKRMGAAVGAAAVLIVLGLTALLPFRWQLMAAWAGWTLAAVVYYTLGGDRRELRRAAPQRKRGAPPAPTPLVQAVADQARRAGAAARIMSSAAATDLVTVRDTIVSPEPLQGRLSAAEVTALAAREIGHLKAGHVTLLNLCRRVSDEQRPLTRILALPLRPLVRALANWRWYAAMSADRMALLLTRDRKVLAAALLKQAVTEAHGISVAEIDEYLNRPGALTAHSAEVTTHFKLGEVLREREDLMFRLRAIAQYAESDEYRQARDRLDGARNDNDRPH